VNGVSIVIPAYNAQRTIGKCLAAATSLEWAGDVEIIVVNDGSSDRTGEIRLKNSLQGLGGGDVTA